MQLVSDESLLYLDSASDPYSSGDSMALLTENISNIDALIGSENYDIGHVFDASNFGGAAYLGTACTENEKAGGASGVFSPGGETFSIEYVAHEIAHQLGATHSFNSTLGSCGGGNRTVGYAVEPGSGSSVMSYSGLCGSDNIQFTTDATFHWKSIEQVYRYTRISGGKVCGIRSSSGSQIPVVNAGGNKLIPANTPFILSGDATGGVSYSWDQIDSGAPTAVDVDSGNNALIRQLLTSPQPDRYIPRLSDLFSGKTTKGETLPQTSRFLNFAFVVRNGVGGVGLSYKRMTVTDIGRIFSVLSQSTPQNFIKGQSIEVTWEVAGTNNDPISCQSIDINLLLGDGEKHSLIESTDNDGSEEVTIPISIPNINDARIMVACDNQSFYQISLGRINIGDDVGDIEPPVITIIGSNEFTIVRNNSYLELGATAVDNIDESVVVLSSGVIDTSQLGRQNIIYTATDAAGNTSTAIRGVEIVEPVDTIAPVIKLIGEKSITIFKGEAYIEQGATAEDNIDTTIEVFISGEVDVSRVGAYSIVYKATDLASNLAIVTRVVKVISEPVPDVQVPMVTDTVAPVISLIGDAAITLFKGEAYIEQGATAEDNVDTTIEVFITGEVDINRIGTYSIVYKATDAANNLAIVTRVVNVIAEPVPDVQVPVVTDTVAPVIKLIGESSITIFKDEAYIEQGATAEDNVDTTIEVFITGEVDINRIGTYSIVYKATDVAGNQATVIRVIKVIAKPIIDQQAPTITLVGSERVILFRGSAYIEQGAVVEDNIDSSVELIISGRVDISTIGSYQVIYSATDSAGNATTTTRSVSIVEKEPLENNEPVADILPTVVVSSAIEDLVESNIESESQTLSENNTLDISGNGTSQTAGGSMGYFLLWLTLIGIINRKYFMLSNSNS